MTTKDKQTVQQAARMLRTGAKWLFKAYSFTGEWDTDKPGRIAYRLHDRMLVTAAALEKMAAE